MAFQVSVLLLFEFELLRSEKYFVAPNIVIRICYNVEAFNDIRSLLMSLIYVTMLSDLSIANSTAFLSSILLSKIG